jgi:uncharacterized protein (TIGR00375 family)
MSFIADFHIHSHFSLATSKQLLPEYLDYWAKRKGIKVIGTGDFTHPGWSKELKQKLNPIGGNLFKLKPENVISSGNKATENQDVRFILTAEISNIYKKNGTVRKIHNILFAPDFETVEKIQRKLQSLKFNITSDGRPILGLDAKDLLNLVLEINPDIFFVPAHIWTPWFSVLGSKSGFDSIEECFEDLSSHIYAIETGLSTDPPLNWMCSRLDRFTLISNSDAHSPDRLGRNANIFHTECTYSDIINALKSGDPQYCGGTIDMYPQEGKYHFDGHRKCNVSMSPVETLKSKEICPICKKRITIGVVNRVVQLSDRINPEDRPNRLPFRSIIPLQEILSEIAGMGGSSGAVQKLYENLLQKSGNEFNILIHFPIDEIRSLGGEILAEVIRRMRAGEIFIKEGFDGEYGEIKVFAKGELKSTGMPDNLFNSTTFQPPPKRGLVSFDLKEYQTLKIKNDVFPDTNSANENTPEQRVTETIYGLNIEQSQAVMHQSGPAIIVAGPGTGKTHVLTKRIMYLIEKKDVHPDHILAITFTNKAAQEIRERIKIQVKVQNSEKIHVYTFHGLGLQILKEYNKKQLNSPIPEIVDEEDVLWILRKKIGIEHKSAVRTAKIISSLKQKLITAENIEDNEFEKEFEKYNRYLEQNSLLDFDDLIYKPVLLLRKYPDLRAYYNSVYKWILVDEYQDINFSQYHLLQLLLPSNSANLFVIGDSNQSIYGFRGADKQFINNFFTDFPESTSYFLKTSYRCSDRILKASENVLQNNRLKSLEGLQKGLKIHIESHPTDKSEAEFIARTIEQMIGGLRFFSMDSKITIGEKDADIESLADFAVLCRTSNQMKAIQKAFHDHSIPYQLVGESSFFKQAIIRDIILALKFIFQKDNHFLNEKMVSLFPELLQEIKQLDLETKSISEIILQIIEKVPALTIDEMDLKKLLQIAYGYNKDMESFLRFVNLGLEIDMYEPDIENATIMTLHASKGLEFECVFIAGCENGLIPYSLFKNQKIDLEEERRLLYVGMTRAKKYLYLTHARKRMIKNKEFSQERSPFLDQIEKDLIDLKKSDYKNTKLKNDGQLSLF